MTPETQAKWDRWCDARIQQKLSSALEMVAEELGKLHGDERRAVQAALDKRDERIDALERQVAELTTPNVSRFIGKGKQNAA